MKTKTSILIAIAALLSGCGQSADSRYDAGYKDGYAEGYNTTLELRATLVEGDWKDKNYKQGYDEGRIQGVNDALKKNNN
jgi:hypothetical protein